MTQPHRTPYCRKIRYGISGAPILDGDDMDGSHAPGVGVAPVLIELVYNATLKDRPASVVASVTGVWTRFGQREQPERTVTTHFTNGPDGWPEWLAVEARLHDPEAQSDVGSEFVRQADQPDETGLTAFEVDLDRQTHPKAASKADRTVAVRALAVVEAALGDTLTPAARETIAEALYAHDHPGWRVPLREADVEPVYWARADAVLAKVLPSAPTRTDPAAAVRDLHKPAKDWSWKAFGCPHNGEHTQLCGYCRACYPCPTIQALDGDPRHLADEAQQQPAPATTITTDADEAQPTTPETHDTCRSIEVAGQTISVRGQGAPAEDDLAFFGEVVSAAKRRYAAEHPDEVSEGGQP